MSHSYSEQCTVTVAEWYICTCARTVWIKDCLSYIHIYTRLDFNDHSEREKKKYEGKIKEKGIEAVSAQRSHSPDLVPVRITFYFWCYFCTLILAHEHMLSYFLCLVADDKKEDAFADGKKGLEVKACACKSALHTLALHTYTHTNFPTLALFCLKASVQYLSLYSSLSSSLPHSVSLFLAHYFFLTSHCLSAVIKITT